MQADLGLPPPAIAISGTDGLQLWFSAHAPIPVADAQRWLQALCRRYLPGVALHRLRLYPTPDREAAAGSVVHAARVPLQQAGGATWSAFVAPDLVPRVKAMGFYLTFLAVSVTIAFGYLFYQENALTPFFVMVFLMGIGGANFALYTLWLPEQYPTASRASAIAFISSAGRFVGVGMIFLVGWGISSYGSLGVPVALTAIALFAGLLLLPFAVETRGKPLPTNVS